MHKNRNWIGAVMMAVVGLMLGVFLAAPPEAGAQVIPANTFAGTGTDQGNTNHWYVISAYANGGSPRVQYVNAQSDKATSAITFSLPTVGFGPFVITNAGATTTNTVYYNGTNLFAAGDKVVIQVRSTDTYMYQRVATNGVAGNVGLFTAISNAVVSGDIVYKMSTAATIPWGATTNSINANSGAFFNGRRNQPILVELDSTGSGQALNAVSGVFQN